MVLILLEFCFQCSVVCLLSFFRFDFELFFFLFEIRICWYTDFLYLRDIKFCWECQFIFQIHRFTCGVDDLLISEDLDLRRKDILETGEKESEQVHLQFTNNNSVGMLFVNFLDFQWAVLCDRPFYSIICDICWAYIYVL